MKNCPACRSESVRTVKDPYHFVESGLSNVFLLGIPYVECADCREKSVEIPEIQQLLAVIARRVVKKEAGLTREEFRFLRKAAELTQAAAAEELSVDRTTVVRWESGEITEIDARSDALMRGFWIRSEINRVLEACPDDLESKGKLLELYHWVSQKISSFGEVGEHEIVIDVTKDAA